MQATDTTTESNYNFVMSDEMVGPMCPNIIQ